MTAPAATSPANKDSARGATRTPSVEQFTGSHQIGTLMTDAPTAAPESSTITRPTLTIEQIVSAPLDQLIAHQDLQVVDITSIDDDRFFGQVHVKHSGEIILALPAGRDPVERDVAIRMLVAHLHGLQYGQWPAHMQTTDLIENGVDAL